MKTNKVLISTFFLLILASCGGGREFVKNPVDNLIRDMSDEPLFSIILYDMDADGSFFKTYKHQYKVIKDNNGTPSEEITDWYEVDEDYFFRNENNMGMEIAAKTSDGKVSKTAAPPGYSNYVGNEKYGRWTQRNGTSFWEFYGQYAFMSSMFNMFAYPVRRSYYDDWRGGYYGRRPYYGPATGTGGTYYGTYSDYNRKSKPTSTWYNKASNRSFRDRVRSRTQRSTSSNSRSRSRYSSGSRSRSRGGGFGK
ncbi:hypothetical protein QQ008_02075 [Fulvivirgaceae bacterium BMA10]|uniref:Lipoprotein n=1 Tax=Splendidivirga corallicola TaxID=3051826 RepID=A0ABT8KHC5_9BACT|nr:hypothetical protein [Fulvivirgaceae bacterium BMA10]